MDIGDQLLNDGESEGGNGCLLLPSLPYLFLSVHFIGERTKKLGLKGKGGMQGRVRLDMGKVTSINPNR